MGLPLWNGAPSGPVEPCAVDVIDPFKETKDHPFRKEETHEQSATGGDVLRGIRANGSQRTDRIAR